MIDGIASGISMSRSSVHRVQPNATAASLVLSGTPRIPSAVRRMTGGIPNTRVASTPGGLPVPKKAMIGMRSGMHAPVPARPQRPARPLLYPKPSGPHHRTSSLRVSAASPLRKLLA